mmetsp:Transcript_15351/g.38107  ORF Transcript_15351/g.38107 Transcript_15351/m.38107 type:complete len:359 (+) Transcript_15351:158-1234(+)|eukprot:CAMPEP_0178987656 /NCGR_PEP_ID=MMETSP0795-20121207/3383_1 /TAXON_ID=88552 /ORGANISM="Amoebophrya sp., Strain Ameob2" /LENGTH=358 /DNA_ID=CAMNT_0020678857 /DNA_START=497 /DNA_END=1573 /DNA_ORIENTATION=-
MARCKVSRVLNLSPSLGNELGDPNGTATGFVNNFRSTSSSAARDSQAVIPKLHMPEEEKRRLSWTALQPVPLLPGLAGRPAATAAEIEPLKRRAAVGVGDQLGDRTQDDEPIFSSVKDEENAKEGQMSDIDEQEDAPSCGLDLRSPPRFSPSDLPELSESGDDLMEEDENRGHLLLQEAEQAPVPMEVDEQVERPGDGCPVDFSPNTKAERMEEIRKEVRAERMAEKAELEMAIFLADEQLEEFREERKSVKKELHKEQMRDKHRKWRIDQLKKEWEELNEKIIRIGKATNKLKHKAAGKGGEACETMIEMYFHIKYTHKGTPGQGVTLDGGASQAVSTKKDGVDEFQQCYDEMFTAL